MKLIRELGLREDYIDKRTGKMQYKNVGEFECPVCGKHVEHYLTRGKQFKTCKNCAGTQRETHGLGKHALYSVLQGMKQRCNNPNNAKYHLYGGRGITICEDWNDITAFVEWAEANGYQEGLTIDRIDRDKGYYPANCEWIPLSDNSSKTIKRRPVIQLRRILVPTKEFVEIAQWESAKKAADALGLVAAHITRACQNEGKTHGGFGWKYVD